MWWLSDHTAIWCLHIWQRQLLKSHTHFWYCVYTYIHVECNSFCGIFSQFSCNINSSSNAHTSLVVVLPGSHIPQLQCLYPVIILKQKKKIKEVNFLSKEKSKLTLPKDSVFLDYHNVFILHWTTIPFIKSIFSYTMKFRKLNLWVPHNQFKISQAESTEFPTVYTKHSVLSGLPKQHINYIICTGLLNSIKFISTSFE